MIISFPPGPTNRVCAVSTAVCTAIVLLAFPHQGLRGQVPAGAAQNALAGSRVFGTKGCAQCHAVNDLGGHVGPDLGRFPGTRSYYDFAAAMWNHLPRMAQEMGTLGIERPRMSAWEIGDLIAFLFWIDYFDSAGDAEHGAQLFAEKNCVVCHQAGGVGGVDGPSLEFLNQYGTPIQVATAMWNHGPAMAEAMQRRGLSRPTFSGAELRDLIAYLKSTSTGLPEQPLYVLPGRSDEGRALFSEKGCVQCHQLQGQGSGPGPDLAARGRQWSLIEFAAAMWNKEPAMTAAMRARGIMVPDLRAGEMADIVGYLGSVQYFGREGNRVRGLNSLRTKGCLNCHSLNGRGGPEEDLGRMAPLASAAAVIAAMWNHILVTGGEAEAVRWPTFRPGEMADLAAFLQAPRTGR
jgi:mono/diheme cytochrome c family protein